jgi:hypothetical protein
LSGAVGARPYDDAMSPTSVPACRTRAALLLALALLAAVLVTGAAQPAGAADDKGLANGAIRFPHGGPKPNSGDWLRDQTAQCLPTRHPTQQRRGAGADAR